MSKQAIYESSQKIYNNSDGSHSEYTLWQSTQKRDEKKVITINKFPKLNQHSNIYTKICSQQE